ncbi:hypothetical protein [Yersinia sp. 1652 StPb PI]|uniref:hypothetical protein n=1 Tax=Yersinia sp. 1652 StPb PI TaxID=3061649 RepID=UPI00355C2AF0
MKIVIFSGGVSKVVNAPDGTLKWHMIGDDGLEDAVDVQMWEHRELSVHKFAYFALFCQVGKSQITEAIIKHGYDV